MHTPLSSVPPARRRPQFVLAALGVGVLLAGAVTFATSRPATHAQSPLITCNGGGHATDSDAAGNGASNTFDTGTGSASGTLSNCAGLPDITSGTWTALDNWTGSCGSGSDTFTAAITWSNGKTSTVSGSAAGNVASGATTSASVTGGTETRLVGASVTSSAVDVDTADELVACASVGGARSGDSTGTFEADPA